MMDREYEHPDDAPGGEPWSAAFELLAGELADRPALQDYAILAAQLQAGALNREGRRNAALRVLRNALDRHPDKAYSISLRLDLGMLLRDEHELDRALAELTAAAELIEALRDRDLGPEFAATLPLFEALVASELGAAAYALGMTDFAQEQLARAEQLALALDDVSGPQAWGGNLVYRLNLAIARERDDTVDDLRERFEEHAWRALLPEETVQQIRVRLAVADVNAAFRRRRPEGAGEAELRELLAAGLTFGEDLRARVFLGRSLLDRGAVDEAGRVLAEASEQLAADAAEEPTRLHLLGLRARHLRASGAPAAALERLLVDELRPAFAAFLDRAARGPLEEGGVSPLLYDWARGALSELFALELAVGADGVERAFGWLGRLHAIGSFAREQGLAAPSIAELRGELLGPRRGVLAFVPGRETSHVFALDDDGLAVLRLGRAFELDRAARALEEAIQSAIGAPGARADARLQIALAAASEAFLPPDVRARLAGWSSVLVVGLDDFGYVPIEALRGVRGEAVGITHAVTYGPSLPVAVWLARRARRPADAAGPAVYYVGHGDPAQGGRPELAAFELDPARLGLDALDRAGVPRVVLTSADAAGLPQRLASAPLASFFLHGVYDGARVRPAGMLIEPEDPGGAWFAADVERLPPFPVALVAACGTDRAPLRRGDDGRGHLRASFFRNGTVCVATATLALEIEATADFCGLVNERLAAGDAVAEAFRSARADARPQRRGVHPVHVHLLHVFGAGDVRPIAPRASAGERRGRAWLPLLAGGMAVLACAGAIARRLPRRSPRRDRSSGGAPSRPGRR